MKDEFKRQFGNWIVESVDMDGVDYMEVRTVDGGFRVMYRSDNPMYALIMSVEDDEELGGLGFVFCNVLASASIVDTDFQRKLFMCLCDKIESVRLTDREIEEGEDESREIISRMREMYVANEELGEAGS